MIVISSYSGKCDFADTVEIHGLDNILKSKIYVGQDIVPIRADSEKDIVPFYAYTIGMSASENGIGTFYLSSKSYVDQQEREFLGWYQRDAIKYVNRCKRKKLPIDEVQFIHEVGNYEEEIKREILHRVSNKNMSLDGLYREMSDYYRNNLYKEMLRVGWDENIAYRWVYGWKRWLSVKRDFNS